jgi:hypothetical protein
MELSPPGSSGRVGLPKGLNPLPTVYVYILSNPTYPELLKIGHTRDDVSERAGSLSSATGVLAPFQIEYWCLTLNAQTVERRVHEKFKSVRENKKREFFKVDLDEAIEEIEQHIIDPPKSFRRVPHSKTSPTVPFASRYTCKSCGHEYPWVWDKLICPECGLI